LAKYDVAIIGSGTGRVRSRHPVPGGVGPEDHRGGEKDPFSSAEPVLHVGCIPTKVLAASRRRLRPFSKNGAELGFEIQPALKINWPKHPRRQR